jgi:hypothetical protein
VRAARSGLVGEAFEALGDEPVPPLATVTGCTPRRAATIWLVTPASAQASTILARIARDWALLGRC